MKAWLSQPLPLILLVQLSLLLLYWVVNDTIFIVIQICIWVALATVTIHELGHVIAGSFMGMKLHFMSAGFLLLTPLSDQTNTLRLRVNQAWPLSFGLTSMYMDDSRDTDTTLRNRLIPYLLGGIIANAAAALLCAVLKYGVGSSSDWLSYMVIFNTILVVATGLPFIQSTDAWQCLKLYKMDAETLLLFRIRNLYYHGAAAADESKLAEWKQQAYTLKSADSIYYVGLLEAAYYCRNKQDGQAIHSLQVSADALGSGEQQQIAATVLHIYRGLLTYACYGKLSESDRQLMLSVTPYYGESFLALSRGVLADLGGDRELGLALLQAAVETRYELLDHNQAAMIEYIASRIVELRRS